ncbi:MAG: glutamate--tRNA ligase [Nanohaloarchaea archaeon]|nr:glutamate--tRNA ligase [Candidatus Nanohaloarchaea archaeon]
MELEELARKYALKNASEYGGECNPGAVIGQIMSEEDFDPQKVQQVAGKVCGEVNQLSVEEIEEELENYDYEEKTHEHDPIPDLDVDEDEEVVVRFAPNPNGPPHIGHARGMVINGELKQKYEGKLILRFDDTDPRNKRPLKTESADAYKMYQEDYDWLGYEVDEVRYSSKNFDKYIEYAEKLIEKEKAYVCFCSQEEGSKYRREGEACPHRGKSVEENMADWEEMKNGEINEGEAVLKVKTDLDHKNPAVRDFAAFRIIEDPDHPITGDKYRVWPMLDLAGALEDHFMGTTHIVRGKDLRASTKRQKYIYDYFDWEYPDIRYWGNIQISGFDAPVSGSTLGNMIEQGELDGWDDARAPTLRALMKRGFQPEAIQEFFIDLGVTEKDIEASAETLESENRDIVDEKAARYFFVSDPIELTIEDVPNDVQPEMQVHPDFPERGTRKPEIERQGKEIKLLVEKNDLEEGFLRLKGLCNLEITDVEKGRAVYREGDHKLALEKEADIVHWCPRDSEEAKVSMPNGSIVEGVLEPSNIDNGEVVQFERFGFVRRERNSEFYFAHQ